jgi:hypothetical protein
MIPAVSGALRLSQTHQSWYAAPRIFPVKRRVGHARAAGRGRGERARRGEQAGMARAALAGAGCVKDSDGGFRRA